MNELYIVCNTHKTVFLADENHPACDRYGTCVKMEAARVYTSEAKARHAKHDYNMRMRRRARAPLHMRIFHVQPRPGFLPKLTEVFEQPIS